MGAHSAYPQPRTVFRGQNVSGFLGVLLECGRQFRKRIDQTIGGFEFFG